MDNLKIENIGDELVLEITGWGKIRIHKHHLNSPGYDEDRVTLICQNFEGVNTSYRTINRNDFNPEYNRHGIPEVLL